MKILSFVTHTPHAYDLANALYDHEFYMLGGIGSWNLQQRLIPENVKFIPDGSLMDNYDIAIAHVGGETEAIIHPSMMRLPLMLISHGMGEPFMTGGDSQYDPYKIAESCKDYRVVCCNEKEMLYWKQRGVQNATWIWHGMKEEFIQAQYKFKEPLIVNSGGWEYMNNVPLLTALNNRGIPWLQKDITINNFEAYKFALAAHNIYVSGTRYSSFPRSRAEAMHTGICVLTTNNWDEDKFIIDGENGFFINDNPDDIMALVNSLDLATIERVGKAGQETARKVFGLEAYRKRWLEEIKKVL